MDNPDDEYISKLINKKIDPFNINHKTSKNLYWDTLLKSIGILETRIVLWQKLPKGYK